MAHDTSPLHPLLRRLDAALLVFLVIARIRIDTLAEAAVLPLRQNDVARHPWLGQLLPEQARRLLAEQGLTDPVGLLLIVAALGCLLAYLLIAELVPPGRTRYWARLSIIWAIVLFAVVAPSLKLVLLRQQSGPASYSHDGGVIQTEAALDYLSEGRNPYVEDYVGTPMAEWGISEFRTALYHYPYLPWTFLFSWPFRWLAERTLGWYDQRFVYLLMFAVTLLLLPRLARDPERKLLLVAAIGLNPIMGSDLIYGQNDSFVLVWIVLSLWLWVRSGHGLRRGWVLASAAALGLACSSKPTAWFLVPYYLLLISGAASVSGHGLCSRLRGAVSAGWPMAIVMIAVIGPYLVWDPAAFVDDVWKWSSGASQTAYQIWGWGASNLLLALGWVKSRFDYWPFWLPELIVGLPLLLVLLRRQARDNGPGRALWSYGLWLFAFFFVSRFLNENYLGFITAALALGWLVEDAPPRPNLSSTHAAGAPPPAEAGRPRAA